MYVPSWRVLPGCVLPPIWASTRWCYPPQRTGMMGGDGMGWDGMGGNKEEWTCANQILVLVGCLRGDVGPCTIKMQYTREFEWGTWLVDESDWERWNDVKWTFQKTTKIIDMGQSPYKTCDTQSVEITWNKSWSSLPSSLFNTDSICGSGCAACGQEVSAVRVLEKSEHARLAIQHSCLVTPKCKVEIKAERMRSRSNGHRQDTERKERSKNEFKAPAMQDEDGIGRHEKLRWYHSRAKKSSWQRFRTERATDWSKFWKGLPKWKKSANSAFRGIHCFVPNVYLLVDISISWNMINSCKKNVL